LIPDDLDVAFIEDFFVEELGDCDIADFFDVQPSVSGAHNMVPFAFERSGDVSQPMGRMMMLFARKSVKHGFASERYASVDPQTVGGVS